MTHDELVERAAAWLRNTHDCIVVLTEHTGSREEPDAIGWTRRGDSILVECKRSRADLYADAAKPWRQDPARAHGRERWFLLDPAMFGPRTPPPSQLIRDKSWGIAVAHGRIVKVHRPPVVDPTWVPARDVVFLIRELQRFQIQGMKPMTWAEHQERLNPPLADVFEARRLMRLDR